MQSTDIPQRLSQPFASTAGQRNTIPITTSTPGEASFVQGFPPETMLPVSAGGVPPDGKDMNGVLFLATGAAAWSAAAGGLYPYNSAYSTLIGGYPKGAVLLMADLSGLWLSTAENNATNPDALGAGWTPATETGFSGLALTTGTVTLTAAQAAKPQIGLAGTLVGNVVLVFPPWVSQWNIFNGTTGAFTVTAKTAAGAGVVLQQGNVNEVYSNGTDFNYALAFASESTYGVAAVATQAQTDAVTLDTVFVTPKKLGNGFSFVAAFPGLVKLPSWLGGFMLQWGATAALSTGSQTASGTITFGTPFGTACYWCGGFPDDVAQVSGWNPITCIFNPPSASACDFVADTGGGSAQPITNPGVHIRWLAVGKG